MKTIVKHTKSIEEFLIKQKQMKEQTEKCYQHHKESLQQWNEGEPVKTWFDSNDNICIEYESGNWWHYNEKGEWW